jgi:hypothetical protein
MLDNNLLLARDVRREALNNLLQSAPACLAVRIVVSFSLVFETSELTAAPARPAEAARAAENENPNNIL